jgi:hypothetical protein
LTEVLKDILKLKIPSIVISYDRACQANLKFSERIRHRDFPLLTTEQLNELEATRLVWLVPKFHLATHIEGCADKYSFNWTDNVGRTCGESVESNWSSFNLLATSTREMGFGHRRDTLNDAMNHWNWRKATGEGEFDDERRERQSLTNYGPAKRILRAYTDNADILLKKRATMKKLCDALGEDRVQELQAGMLAAGGNQFRPRSFKTPSRIEILKQMKDEEARQGSSSGYSVKLTGSVGINMGLELEMRQ